MTEDSASGRISRKDDEVIYQPRVHAELIREYHRLAVLTGKPMTFLVDRALRSYLFVLNSNVLLYESRELGGDKDGS